MANIPRDKRVMIINEIIEIGIRRSLLFWMDSREFPARYLARDVVSSNHSLRSVNRKRALRFTLNFHPRRIKCARERSRLAP